MGTVSITSRIASTATLSENFRSPWPIVRAAAIAAASQTRKKSRDSSRSVLRSSPIRFDLLVRKVIWLMSRSYYQSKLQFCKQQRLCTKSGKSDVFLCGLCVSLRPSALKRPINAENTEIRRGPQRKDFHPNSIFCAKPAAPALQCRAVEKLSSNEYSHAHSSFHRPHHYGSKNRTHNLKDRNRNLDSVGH